jgi:hypothetical protein
LLPVNGSNKFPREFSYDPADIIPPEISEAGLEILSLTVLYNS